MSFHYDEPILYMGTPAFSADLLETLIQKQHVCAVVSQPDRPRGRGLELQQTPVKAAAQKYGIPVIQPEKTNDPQFVERVRSLQPALIAVFAYGAFLKKELLEIPKWGCINLHSSLLPKYRGAAPVQRAVMNGEIRTGWTTFFMDLGMDSGDIIDQVEIAIRPDEDASCLFERMLPLGIDLMHATLRQVWDGKYSRVPQNRHEATFAPMLKKSDGLIAWNCSAEVIVNRIRGLVPWPAAFTSIKIKGQSHAIKIFKAKVLPLPQGRAGQILEIRSQGFVVAAGSGSLLIEEVQWEGSKRMSVPDFLKGHPLTPGMILGE